MSVRIAALRRLSTVLAAAISVAITAAVVALARADIGDSWGFAAIAVSARPVPLDYADPERISVGRLLFRGGLALSSTDARFGGLSGLIVDAEGRRFNAVTDEGHWLRGTLAYDERGNLAGIGDVAIAPMRGLDGAPLADKQWQDAEALTRDPEGGFLVAFEHIHRLWRYAQPTPVPVTWPSEMTRVPRNGGVEAATFLADGRLLLLTEQLRSGDGNIGWLRDRQGRWARIVYRTDGEFRPTDAAVLANGDVLVLERRFPPLGVRVMRVDAKTIRAGAILVPEELARLEGSLSVDNMEGIAVRHDDAGRTFVYLVSDDNFSVVQRNLLLMFELLPARL